jgi:hypothetical protein
MSDEVQLNCEGRSHVCVVMSPEPTGLDVLLLELSELVCDDPATVFESWLSLLLLRGPSGARSMLGAVVAFELLDVVAGSGFEALVPLGLEGPAPVVVGLSVDTACVVEAEALSLVVLAPAVPLVEGETFSGALFGVEHAGVSKLTITQRSKSGDGEDIGLETGR